ncbi:M28 family peptidase [Flavisolibacter ginsenosidimutans]|nr:M28 family peptidase [Flavisolibacter ginsenosidimutans]
MKRVLTALFTSGVVCVFAQSGPKPDAYAKTISAADMKKHLYTLASPEMEGRETGTEGQRKAAAYIENYVKSLGLQPGNGSSYQMPYNLYQDSLISAALEVNGKAFELNKDFAASPGGPQSIYRLSEVTLIGTGATDSLKSADLAGKAVMIVGTISQNFFAQLNRKSPAVVLTVSANFPRTGTANNRGRQGIHAFKASVDPVFFQVSEAVARAIAGDKYDAVKASSSSVQKAKTELLLDTKKATVVLPASDVIAFLPGTDLKDQYLVFSAHYDHLGMRNGVLFPGADDDGSGTVGVLEIAEAFAKAAKEGKGPRRSIVFLWNSGEEKGLLGSEWYTDHPVYPLDKTTADLNIDMIGRSDPDRKPDTLNYVYVVGDDKLSSDLKPISESINNKYTKLQLDYKYNDPNDKERIYFRSDHYNFARYGVPIIFYYDGMLRPDYHKPSDTPDKINYDLMQKRAQLVFYTGWEMANRDAMLKRDIPLNVPTGF